MRYRRAFAPGGSFFFTVVTRDREPLFAHADAVARLREAFHAVRAARPFELDAAVILPDHLHCIWTLPPGDTDFSTRWRLVKSWFTKRQAVRTPWQPRYWEHQLRNEDDLARHVDYIHFNPVKHGHAATAMDWPHSSFRRYVAQGLCPADWAGTTFEGTGPD